METIQAVVLLKKGEFFAELSDGRRLVHGELWGLAEVLQQAGVLVADTRFEWRSGHRMLTAGQQVALLAELSRLEKERAAPPQAPCAAEPRLAPDRGIVRVA